MEYWKASIYPMVDLDDLRSYVRNTNDSSDVIIKRLSTIRKETEFNITLCKNSQSEDANEIRELGGEIISYIDCEVYKLSDNTIVSKPYLTHYMVKDLFNRDILDYLKSNSYTLLEDIREYLETHQLGKEVFALIVFLYDCEHICYWDKNLHKKKNGCLILNKPQTLTKWRDRFCDAFEINVNNIKNYKRTNNAVIEIMQDVKDLFSYLDC